MAEVVLVEMIALLNPVLVWMAYNFKPGGSPARWVEPWHAILLRVKNHHKRSDKVAAGRNHRLLVILLHSTHHHIVLLYMLL